MINFFGEDIENYCHDHTTGEDELYKKLEKETNDKTDNPGMLVGRIEGTFLKLLVRMVNAKRVLEIGTFTGYSALMMAEALPENGKLITCDIDKEVTEIAQRYWASSPHGHKIELTLGPALESINKLEGPFDLVFIDADKENYSEYWEACVPKVRPGGVIIADNVLWSGQVLDPQEESDRALATFNTRVKNDTRVDAVMLTVRDGITLARKH